MAKKGLGGAGKVGPGMVGGGYAPSPINKPNSVNKLAKPGMGSEVTPAKPKPAPKYQPPPDPRDSTYYANTAALTNMLGQNTASALLDQTLADNSFAENSERMTTDRERARRNLAESLLGTGGIRSGSHRRDQTEGDQDYMVNRNRLGYDYGNDKARRELEIAGYKTDYDQQMLGAYGEAQDRYAAKVKSEAETGTGNSAMTKAQKNKATQRKNVKRDTKAIKTLKERLADADKEQAAKIRQRLTKVRKRRATIVKKMNNG
jgi:hypothetical protein